jgi:hypothetical protein
MSSPARKTAESPIELALIAGRGNVALIRTKMCAFPHFFVDRSCAGGAPLQDFRIDCFVAPFLR